MTVAFGLSQNSSFTCLRSCAYAQQTTLLGIEVPLFPLCLFVFGAEKATTMLLWEVLLYEESQKSEPPPYPVNLGHRHCRDVVHLFVCHLHQQVYYGFTANFLKWGKLNVFGFDEWMVDMKRLLDQEGVLYKGQCEACFRTV